MRSRLFTLRSLTYLAGLVAIIALMLYLHHQASELIAQTPPLSSGTIPKSDVKGHSASAPHTTKVELKHKEVNSPALSMI